MKLENVNIIRCDNFNEAKLNERGYKLIKDWKEIMNLNLLSNDYNEKLTFILYQDKS